MAADSGTGIFLNTQKSPAYQGEFHGLYWCHMKTHPLLQWYQALPEFAGLDAVFDNFQLQRVPDDWVVYITDVVGSTKAIEAGRYKDVNMAGSLPTIAMANLIGSMHFPFVFGGDGMTAILPKSLDHAIRGILGRTKTMVSELIGLDLRVGAVPVNELTMRGAAVYVARIRVSDRYIQALIWGEGMNLAEEMVKGRDQEAKAAGPGRENPWLIAPEGTGESLAKLAESADFQGFSCRWQPIPSHLGLTVSILVQPTGDRPEATLKEVLARIRGITGGDEANHPLSIKNQRLNADPRVVHLEADVAGYDPTKPGLVDGKIRNLLRRMMVRLTFTVARIVIKLQIGGVKYAGQEARYKREQNRANSDVRKVDGMLKMVIACTPAQGKELERYLAEARKNGMVRYGLHVSDRALMTCFVHDGTGNEVHFVDSDGGGYARAAKMLKAQIAADAV